MGRSHEIKKGEGERDATLCPNSRNENGRRLPKVFDLIVLCAARVTPHSLSFPYSAVAYEMGRGVRHASLLPSFLLSIAYFGAIRLHPRNG